jgi:hypothetical protein
MQKEREDDLLEMTVNMGIHSLFREKSLGVREDYENKATKN